MFKIKRVLNHFKLLIDLPAARLRRNSQLRERRSQSEHRIISQALRFYKHQALAIPRLSGGPPAAAPSAQPVAGQDPAEHHAELFFQEFQRAVATGKNAVVTKHGKIVIFRTPDTFNTAQA